MSGRAIILLVVGIIVISGTILYRIEAGSTAIVANSVGYYKKQSARNIAQTGVNLALRKLGSNSSWRTSSWVVNVFDGKTEVTAYDTSYAGVKKAIGVRSIATFQDSVAVSTVFCYFPQPLLPPDFKGLLTLNAPNQTGGTVTVDGRDHNVFDAINVNATKGTYGIWTTGASFSQTGSSKIGGTVSGGDWPPALPAPAGTIQLGQVFPGGFPGTPDSMMGGSPAGYDEGTLKSIAQSGVAGSQYVTDPLALSMPLSGVTYVEMPIASPSWSGGTLSGIGILVVHNTAKTAVLKTSTGTFAGIILADDLTNFHTTFWGGIGVLTSAPVGNALGTGSPCLYYSRDAILKAVGMLSNGTGLNVIAWWE